MSFLSRVRVPSLPHRAGLWVAHLRSPLLDCSGHGKGVGGMSVNVGVPLFGFKARLHFLVLCNFGQTTPLGSTQIFF